MTQLPVFKLLDTPRATAWYTCRGVADCTAGAGPYDGFNVCHYTGDAPARVDGCRKELSTWAGVEEERLVIPRQTHSCRVLTVKDVPLAAGALEGVDALVTRCRGIVMGVNTADCVPLVLIDPGSGVCGVAHAGWRGALGGIAVATLRAMQALGADPGRTVAAMGPSICPGCFEVGEEVAALFPDTVVDRSTWPRPHVDLQGYVAMQLAGSGLREGNITPWPAPAALCTRHNPGRYFSARALGVASGRVFTFVTI